jgi:hypothetical protein
MFEIADLILLILVIFMLIMTMLYRQKYLEILSQKKSSEVRLGQIAEHLVPFVAGFRYNPKDAKFLGMPIDYIVFAEDKVVFLEVKTGGARLNKTQQRIKEQIESGKVVWEEFRLEAKGATPIKPDGDAIVSWWDKLPGPTV